MKSEQIKNEVTDKQNFMDRIIKTIGLVTSWLSVILLALIIVQVLLRYVLKANYPGLEELQWHLYSIGIMIGLSYALTKNTHIRLDVLHHNFPIKTQAIIEIFGILIFLLPFSIILTIHGYDYFLDSFNIGERSDSPAGLPYRWIIKSFIPISFGLLSLAGISRLINQFIILAKSKREVN